MDSGPISKFRENRDNLQQNLTALAKVFGEYSDVIDRDSSVRSLEEITNKVAKDTKEMQEDDRLLRLGVVGQVKAGKSSLLNLLLFKGEEVLPKAATPMTASLTHIVKSDRDEIKIEYYSHEDWEDIRKHAREFQRAKEEGDERIPEFVEASHELVAMAKERGLRVDDHLGKTQTLVVPTPKFNEELRRLVGSEGDLMPLVKSVAIHCSQGIPDLNIVDTPGINDPIRSRSRQANKLLSRCDAVLLLSYAGQFMDNVDVGFFVRRVPQEGIHHRLVIGSKFDSSLIDVSRDHRGNLDQAQEDTRRRLEEHGREAIARLDEEQESKDLPESTIVFVSAMCATLAAKPASRWTREEQHVFEGLQRAYPDWLDQPDGNQDINEPTQDILAEVGNKEAIDDQLRKVRENKDDIISQKIESFLREKRSQALEELDELIGSLEEKRTSVREGDIEELKAQQRDIGALQEELILKVGFGWEDMIDKRAEAFDKFREDIRKAFEDAKAEINDAVSYRTVHKKKKVKKKGVVSWFARKIWGGGYEDKDVSYEKKVTDRQAQKFAVEEFKDWLEDQVTQTADKMFNRPFQREATQKISWIVSNEFSNDLASKMDMTAVKRSLREAVAQIAEGARKRFENYGLVVGKGKEAEAKHKKGFIASLTLSPGFESTDVSNPREAARQIFNAGTKWLDFCKNQIDEVAAQAKTDLVPAAVKHLQDYQDRMKKDIEDREFILQRYDRALKKLEECRQCL